MPRKLTMPASTDVMERVDAAPAAQAATARTTANRGSGRVRHDEKITVYVSREELVRLEQARLTLRAEHGVAVDRGRIVREAVAMCLDDLAANGESSVLLDRLTNQ